MAYFFASLFVRNPEFRPMFPLAMVNQRQQVFEVLAKCVWGADEPESLADYLRQLAVDHRRYGVMDSHYRPFCDAMLAAVQMFASTTNWTARAETAWRSFLDFIADAMTEGARDAADEPAWWVGEVIRHDRRGSDLAVLTLRPEPGAELPFRPGQYLTVQVPRWPRVWRRYSIASLPRANGTLDLHVRAVPRGRVSNVLVTETSPGDPVLIGPARGSMTADCAAEDSSVLCVAGGTGLAPLKAIAEDLARPGRRPEAPGTRLLVGARDECDLYDMPDLRLLEATCPDLSITAAVPDRHGSSRGQGILPAVARALPEGPGDVFVCGPPAMVRDVIGLVAEQAPHLRVHADGPGCLRGDRRGDS
jgi:NAD(P)H-flavin reductase